MDRAFLSGADVKFPGASFICLSIVVIFLCLAALYESWSIPISIMLILPLGIFGAAMATWSRGMHNDVYFQIGFLTTLGLTTKNAILIVDFTNQLKAQGKYFKDALIIAGKERMRPILMTTLAMAIGMLPIALAQGTASEWKNGLAWVIIGGLLSSMILTVYLVPMMYYIVDTIKEKIANRKVIRKVDKANLIGE